MSERVIQMMKIIDDTHPEPSHEPDRYLQPRQAQRRNATLYEDLLGDAIERAFGAGIQDLPGLVANLNEQNIATPDGGSWTEANYLSFMAELSQQKTL